MRWLWVTHHDKLTRMADNDTDESAPKRWNALGPNSNMWMNWDDDPRNSGEEPEGERATLLEYLRGYRLVLEMKCADLDADQLARRSVPPSTMSLLGLIRHMADVERNWFRRVMAGQDAPPLYWVTGVADADWAGAVADPAVVAEAWQSWRDEVAFAERFVADAEDLGIRGTMRDGSSVALREVIVHMIEEYARHSGHADLLRERIDGRVGQLSPGGRPPVPPVSLRAGPMAKSAIVSDLPAVTKTLVPPRDDPVSPISARAGLIAKGAILSGPPAGTENHRSLRDERAG